MCVHMVLLFTYMFYIENLAQEFRIVNRYRAKVEVIVMWCKKCFKNEIQILLDFDWQINCERGRSRAKRHYNLLSPV